MEETYHGSFHQRSGTKPDQITGQFWGSAFEDGLHNIGTKIFHKIVTFLLILMWYQSAKLYITIYRTSIDDDKEGGTSKNMMKINGKSTTSKGDKGATATNYALSRYPINLFMA